MSGKFMKIKRIVIPTITLIIMTSQLLGCSSVTSKEMLDMIDRQEAIVIEVPEPISEEQGTTIEYEWTELASLTTYPEFRTTFDDTFNIVPYGIGGKAGTVYIDLSGNQTNNSTLYNALMNQKFAEAWNNTDNLKKIIASIKETYVDIDSDTEAITAALNAYFNLTSDAEPNYYNGNSTLTRGEYLGMLYRASTPVEDLTDKAGLTESIEDTDTALFASQLADKSYLTTADSSLNTSTFNSTIIRAEAIYTIVQQYYSDEYGKVTGKENSYSDAKNGGNIAEKAGFITKDKKTGEVTEKKYWKSYELSYSMQNESKGMPTDLYKALVVAKNHNLITGDESRWSDGLTKTEAINLITAVYEDLAETNGYINNAERGNATGESIDGSENTVVEQYDDNSLFPGFSSENITINSDGTREYNEAFYNECRNYNCFEGATDDQIKKMVDKYTSSEFKAEDYHNTFTMLDEIDMTVYDYLNIPNPNKTKDSSESSTNSSTTTNNSSTTNTNSNSSKDSTESNNTSSTPSQDTDLTKGYGDAGGNNTSEAPVQSVDDGAPDVDISSLMGKTDYGENTGGTIDLE